MVNFSRRSLYGAVPDAALTLAGVEGALLALGKPCAPSEGGTLVDTSDVGLAFHGLHAVALHEPSKASSPHGSASKKKRLADDADTPAADDDALATGILGGHVDFLATSAASSAAAASVAVARLSWSVPQFHRMVDSGVGSEQRSAVHRAMYQGVRLRMLREIKAPKASKKLKAE